MKNALPLDDMQDKKQAEKGGWGRFVAYLRRKANWPIYQKLTCHPSGSAVIGCSKEILRDAGGVKCCSDRKGRGRKKGGAKVGGGCNQTLFHS